jgi:hypothetical protein
VGGTSAAGQSRAQLTATGKLGTAARVAGRQVQKTRWWRAAWGACSVVGSSFGRVLHQLWLQLTGVLFLAFAIVGGLAFAREYQAWAAGKMGPERALLALAFTLLFAWFGVSSFWRAVRK